MSVCPPWDPRVSFLPLKPVDLISITLSPISTNVQRKWDNKVKYLLTQLLVSVTKFLQNLETENDLNAVKF